MNYSHSEPDGRKLEISRVFNDGTVNVLMRDNTCAMAVSLDDAARMSAADTLAGGDYRVIPVTADEREIEQARADEAATMQDDLHSILHALGLSTAARAPSPHEVVEHGIVPAIWRAGQERDDLRKEAYETEAQTADDHSRYTYDATCPKCRDLPAQPDRPEPVDPTSVRVGDEILISTDDGKLHIEGRVKELDSAGVRPFLVDTGKWADWVDIDGTTVRILHAAEPEPDEAAVEALADIVHDVNDSFESTPLTKSATKRFVRELIRRGVEVSE